MAADTDRVASGAEGREHEQALSTSVLFGAACVITIAGLILPHDSRVDEAGLIVVAFVAGVVAVVLAVARERVPRAAYPGIAVLGSGLVALSLFCNGQRHGGPVGSDEMFYLWVTLWAAYYFTRRALAFQVGTAIVSYAVTLALIHPGDAGISRFVSLSGLVIGAAVVVRMLAERNERLVQELRAAALTDPLTGLANRRGLEAAFAREAARTARTGEAFGLLVMDLDRFKQLNDERGHKAGDRALVEIADLLRGQAREIDTASRIGGDEFALLLSGADAAAVADVRARLDEALARHAQSGTESPIAASIGTAVSETDGAGIDALMRHADMRLYVEKRDRHRARHPALRQAG